MRKTGVSLSIIAMLAIGSVFPASVAGQIQTTAPATTPVVAAKPPFNTLLQWKSTGVLIKPVSDANHTIVSVKDPTVVRYNGLWHIYATVYSTSSGTWSMVYLNFKDWADAPGARLHFIDQNPNLKGYHCAPHIFYFTPHRKWYMIFQSQQPQYSTTDDISKPETWTKPTDFFPVKPASAPQLWIDYHLICDDTHAYLFFTGDDGRFYRSRTRIEDFPKGMSDPEIAISDSRNNLFEASITYRIKGTQTYLTLIEALSPARHYRAWTSDCLDGKWTPVAGASTWEKPFAGIQNVAFEEGATPWTRDISHGEMIRDGYDEKMLLDPDNLQMLYQGRDPNSGGNYNLLPYQLGLLRATAQSSSGGFNPIDQTAANPVAPGDMPLVYDRENTGADVPKPAMPAFSDLSSIPYLPDPFKKADGSRIATREEWRVRRAEIKATLERYDVGEKPGKPGAFKAALEGDTIRITVGEGADAFNMTAVINRPGGAPDAPIPAIIGVNSPTGSLPRELFSSRGIASIAFRANEVAPTGFGGVAYESGNFMKLYPDATAGYMIRWAWGVSRIIDALEALPEAKIDVKRLAVSGCSFQGKIALYAGAFDERIALTIPHESGGGGTISWRYSDMLEKRDKVEVENLLHAQGSNDNFPWYARALRQFNNDPDKLPFDHHELIAMIAPRAVLMIESSQVARMGAEAARVSALAAREVWKALGVPDRMGATEQNVGHCAWHPSFTPDLEAYLDKFLLGKKDGPSTDILRSRFAEVDRKQWIPWSTPELK